jgi:hypothetical protein
MKSIKLAFIALAVLPLLSLFGCEIQAPAQAARSGREFLQQSLD